MSTIYDRYHDAGERPHVIPCSVFGGRSPKTGDKVGQRHRWDGPLGHCAFCGKHPDDVLSRPRPVERSLDEIIRDGR